MSLSRLLGFTTVIVFLFLAEGAISQFKFTLSGYVKDVDTGEDIIGANVYIRGTTTGTTSNTYGFYSLTLSESDYEIVCSFIGYNTETRKIELTQNISIDFELSTGSIVTDQAIIEGKESSNVDGTEMSRVKLEMKQVKTLPALLGEVDVLKTIQLLPGVQSAGEGNAGFYVRGGGPDQNLILLDNAVVYNPTHLLGFFSVFNSDAIKNIEIIKGGMPANYGGRLASVLDVSLKEGNTKNLGVEGGIGLISSRLTVDGPIVRDKSSFIISGRRTYADVLARPFVNPESDFVGSSYYFYDINAKANYQIGDKDRVYLSGYYGRDIFTFSDKNVGFTTDIPWGNTIASLRWNHLFSPKLFMNTIATFSDYQFQFGINYEDFDFRLKSGIQDWSGKIQLNYYPSVRHEIKGGVDYTFHEFTPTTVKARSGETSFDTGDELNIYSHELAGYLTDEFDLSEALKVSAGLRGVYFAHVGPYTKFIQPDEQDAFTQLNSAEVIKYDQGDKIADYWRLEPRLSARYKVWSKGSIKGSYTHNYQFLHLASLSATSLPTDIWIPSTDQTLPQFGIQYTLGYFQNFLDGAIEASVEGYYKKMEDLVEYKEGTLIEDLVDDNIDNHLTSGTGYSYGVEFFVNKKFGDLTGWIGYTWSRTNRQFDEINQGNEYPAKFDRTHDLSIVLGYNLEERWVFATTFVYATGNAVTLPLERYFIEGRVVDVYGERNSFRMDSYHRVDISVTYDLPEERPAKPGKGKEARPRKIDSSFTFSVYNCYNRRNPYFIFFANDGDLQSGELEVQAIQVSLFPILPSISWNFKF